MNYLCSQDSLSIDTETGGLNYRRDKLLLVQIATADGKVYMVRHPNRFSHKLSIVLTDSYSKKIFHNAAFDLKFIHAGMGYEVAGQIECTKTLMKVCKPELRSGLGSSLREILSVKVNKKINHKLWDAKKLSRRQLEYASQDVLYLHKLLKELKTKHLSWGDKRIYQDAIKAIQLKSSLEVRGYTDLLDYQQNDIKKSREERDWFAGQLQIIISAEGN